MSQTLQGLLTAGAVRERCTVIGELALANKTRWFRVNESKIDPCAELVADVCRQNYPNLNIPYHSRWRHFLVNGINLWDHYCQDRLTNVSTASKTRSAIDLIFVSVLLDAGAGSTWHFVDPVTETKLSRSEGLAAASIHLFFNKLARYQDGKGCYVDAQALRALTLMDLSESFQHTAHNSLVGVEGRLQLLHGLGMVLSASDTFFRPGDIYDVLISNCSSGAITAADILNEVLVRFRTIWPSGLIHNGFNLGDAGYHKLLETKDNTNRIVPFHKLSQWLSYSLIEPLEWSGLSVTGMDDLTGLPEYRNGGLLIDTGVIEPTDRGLLVQKLSIDSEAVVEWRALTVFLLDQIANKVRTRLGKNQQQLPLSSILQGGTWAAGRRIASELRPDASPPIKLAIDGTIF